MAHKLGTSSTKNGRDSHSQRLGLKCTGLQFVKPGMILIRQRGTKFKPGNGVSRGSDDTLFALCSGYIHFTSNNFINIFNFKTL